MKRRAKIACTMAAVLLLLPIRGQAADTASASREKKPVVSMGNRPGAVVLGASQNEKDTKQNKADKYGNTEIKNTKNSGAQVSRGNKTDTKRGVKTKQTEAAKRNLNAIYILPKGYKDITIKGKGTIDAGVGICIMCNGADAVINLAGSTTVYQTDRAGAELIYCYSGTIIISGGTFKNNGSPYLLNCYDANYKNGTANIVVTGGKFYDFNPGNNTAEGPNTSFLAEGYTTISSTVIEEGVEHTVYTVKKD